MQTTMNEKEVSGATGSAGSCERFRTAFGVLEEAIAAHAFPGCAFGVLSGGAVVLQDALGYFTYEDDSPTVSPGTMYDVASVTKVVATTAMTMLLAQRGQLDVDDLLGDWLPGFVIGREPGDHAREVRLRHLLAHNSGLPGYVEFFRNISDPAGLLRACLALPLEAEPGTRAEYSDPGFILLGKVLEVCTGEHLDAWTRREIFAPLGPGSTRFCPPKEAQHTIPPTEEDEKWRHRRIQGEVQDENASVLGGVAGHAGLFSNVPDLLSFSAEILRGRGGAISGAGTEALFHRDTIAAFAERQLPIGSSRALGWDTPSENSSSGKYFSRESIGHLGYSGCSMWIDLDEEIAVVLLTNRTWPDRANQLIKQVRPAFHDAIREAL
jgi:serine-type D-Ala-D-Ala carboxypeptidase